MHFRTVLPHSIGCALALSALMACAQQPYQPDVPGQSGPPRRLPSGPLAGKVEATNKQRISAPRLTTYEFNRKLQWLYGDAFRVNFNQQTAVLRTPGSGYPVQMRFQLPGYVEVTGAPAAIQQLERMLATLEQSAGTNSARAIVSRRRGVLDRIEWQSRQQPSIRSGVQPAQFSQQVGPGGTPKTLAPATRQRLKDLGENVQVEVLPDMDAIILRGRDQDIDDLAKIIQELERAAAGAQSKIEIVPLQHARDERVAELVDDVQEQYTGARQGRVTVTPLSKPNAALVIGWGQAFDATIELIRQLDTPVASNTQMQVFQLRHATASLTAQTIEQFFANRDNLGTQVTVTSDPRTNAVVVHAAPRDMEEVQQLVKQLDLVRGQSANVLRVYELKNAIAADIASVLNAALDGQRSADERNAALEVLMVDAQGRETILSGNLEGIRITPNVANNSLIVSANGNIIAIIDQLIQQMDSERTPSQIKLFRIAHGDAATLVTVLRSLLISNDAGVSRLPNAAGQVSLAPLRFAVEQRTNSIIASGPTGDLRIVEALLAKLDEGESNARTNAVYHLKNAPAVDVAAAINQFLVSKRQIEANADGGLSLQLQLDKEVVVVPEPVNNKLILSATPRYFDELHNLIQRLDEPPPQVVIQVLIGEVTLDNTEEFGVEVGLQDTVLFDRSLLGDLVTTVNTTQTSTADGVVTLTEEIIQAATNTPGFNFNNFPLGNSGSTQALTGASNVAGQGLSNFAVGRINNELGFGGLVLSASSENVSILIRALQQSRRIEVLSRPQIRTLDNQSAYIQVGQRVPQIVNSSITQFGQTNSIAFSDVGLILGVTPRISPDDTVVMEIDAEKSSIASQEGVPISALQDGTVIRAPIFNSTRAQSTVSAASGETIILAGLITKENAKVNRGVPYLSNLPVLGNLFRYDSASCSRTELLIILTPHIIRSQEDSERLKQAELAKMSWCAADVYELQGDVNYHVEDPASLIEREAAETIYPDYQNEATGAETLPKPMRDAGSMTRPPAVPNMGTLPNMGTVQPATPPRLFPGGGS